MCIRDRFVAGREVALTPQEFMLLGVLVRNRNLALSREKLLQLAWGYDYEGDTRTVDVHIQKPRKKLGFEDRIQTVYQPVSYTHLDVYKRQGVRSILWESKQKY